MVAQGVRLREEKRWLINDRLSGREGFCFCLGATREGPLLLANYSRFFAFPTQDIGRDLGGILPCALEIRGLCLTRAEFLSYGWQVVEQPTIPSMSLVCIW